MLPIYDHKAQILSALKTGSNLIVRAPTGSGKSTQVPQMLLDSGMVSGKILILQPRRLAARMLAMRVASERNSEIGNEIGFLTRFETAVSSKTKACFITEGILPRLLLDDKDLRDVSVVIFDEFHERNAATDIGLALVRSLQKSTRPDIKIIVMSATMDTVPVAAYLDSATVIESGGRLYPVAIRYLPFMQKIPVWDMAASAVVNLLKEGVSGDILVFMPGTFEIRRTIEAIQTAVRTEPCTVLPLFGDLTPQKQQQVMEPLAKRKIIVATNIAETSLTIPGVRHVIDSGLAKVNRYDAARGFNTLYTEAISIDSADQRAGRAGREERGICIRLWSASQHEGRSRQHTPEVLRIDLSDIILGLYTLGYNDSTFAWFEKPPDSSVAAAMALLARVGAVDKSGQLTDKGLAMSHFPVHPRMSSLLLEAGKRGAVNLAAFCAAILGEKQFVGKTNNVPEEAMRCDLSSDFYAHYCIYKKLVESNFDPVVCSRYDVNVSAVKNIQRTYELFLGHCKKARMDLRESPGSVIGLAKSLLLSYPDHIAARKDQGTLLCRIAQNRHGELAKESICRGVRLFIAADIREVKDKNHGLKTILSMGSEIQEEWLMELFPDEYKKETFVVWNSVTEVVETKQGVWCCDVLIEEKPVKDVLTDKASQLLAETVVSRDLVLQGWNQEAQEWINRVCWVGKLFPEQNMPAFSQEDKNLVVHAMCDSEYRYDKIREKPVLPFLKELLNYQQQQFVDSMAPPFIQLPLGRKMKLTYEPGAQPRGRTRIQDVYGMTATPRIASGRANILIELLAPNNRPVQITDDLEGFWKNHYPELKKALSRRYPRHEWR